MKTNLLSLLVVASLLVPAAVLAQPAPAPAPPAAAVPVRTGVPTLAESLSADAKADYESAKLLYGDGDFAGALVKFKSAHDKSKDVRLLWNIASCEKSLRHYANVLRLLREYLKEGDAVLTQLDKDEARNVIAAIEPLTASLKLSVNEPGAEVYVDDVLIGTSPLDKPVTVDIGMRKVLVKKQDYTEFAKELPVGGSPEIKLDVKIEKVLHEGKLVVNAGAKDEIFVDGKAVGVGAWSGVLPSGGHMLRVAAADMRPYQSEVIIRDRETRSVPITLDKEIKPSSGLPAWAWIGGGVLLAAGAAVGGYFIFKPEDKQPSLPVGTLDPGNVQASYPALRFR